MQRSLTNIPLCSSFLNLKNTKLKKSGKKPSPMTKGGITRAVVGGAAFGLARGHRGASTAKQETMKKGGVAVLYLDLDLGGVKTTVSIQRPPLKAPEFLDNIIDEK